MRQVALLYNPDSGRKGNRRLRALEAALAVLRKAGVTAELVPTHSPEDAGEKAGQAIRSGCDTVFACGGDGTVHNIVQVLAKTSVALGLLPMGTANALAHDLRIPLDPPRAARTALEGVTRRVALGHVKFTDLNGGPSSRYFIITAGVGVDAHLFYQLLAGTKRRMGMAAYYYKAWHLWLTYRMRRFVAEYVETGSETGQRCEVTELMSVRIRNFGGVLQELAPGASLERNDMRVVFCQTGAKLAYLAYVTRGLLRRNWRVRGIELAHCTRVSCHYGSQLSETERNQRIYVEADGELIGTLPVEMMVVPDALTIVAPRA
jgi:diacylglycerol kinase (ATP)